MEESIHWEQLRAGDMQGLQVLYELHVDALYAYGMVLCQDADRVKDCIQDLFLYCWHSRAHLSVPVSGKAYLMVSLRRRIFDPGPKSNLPTHAVEETGIDRLMHAEDHEQNWIQAETDSARQQKLSAALSRISGRQREIIHMKYYQQMEYEEIARIMDLNYQSARNLVTRALMALRKEMALILWILWLGM
jgi:RNA polymerase sigma factor (sigma-70 family)